MHIEDRKEVNTFILISLLPLHAPNSKQHKSRSNKLILGTFTFLLGVSMKSEHIPVFGVFFKSTRVDLVYKVSSKRRGTKV